MAGNGMRKRVIGIAVSVGLAGAVFCNSPESAAAETGSRLIAVKYAAIKEAGNSFAAAKGAGSHFAAAKAAAGGSITETAGGVSGNAAAKETTEPGVGIWHTPESPNGHIVAVDPGHQAKGNGEKEPIGPGSVQTKAKVAGGTKGVSSGVPEYQLTLAVSLLLREELLERGYTVYMIRETNEVNISNRERADMAGEAGADILLRIHADGAESQKAKGSSALCPTKDSPYCAALYRDSRRLSDAVLENMTEASGAKSRGVTETDAMSGINWSTVPVSIIEMGFMTNPREDEKMQTAEYQAQLAKGMADGVDAYFNGS